MVAKVASDEGTCLSSYGIRESSASGKVGNLKSVRVHLAANDKGACGGVPVSQRQRRVSLRELARLRRLLGRPTYVMNLVGNMNWLGSLDTRYIRGRSEPSTASQEERQRPDSKSAI